MSADRLSWVRINRAFSESETTCATVKQRSSRNRGLRDLFCYVRYEVSSDSSYLSTFFFSTVSFIQVVVRWNRVVVRDVFGSEGDLP